MTEQQLGAVAGVILSLALAYLPRVSDWYNAKDSRGKAQVMAALLIGSALGIFGLSCAGVYDLVACTVDGAKELLTILIAALVANQSTFTLFVKPYREAQG